MSTPGTAPKLPPARVWESRTGTVADDLLAYSESVRDDAPFTVDDLCGSVAHVLGLRKSGLLTPDEATRLVTALQGIAKDHASGVFTLDPTLEDLHMNLEARVTAELGDTGRKLHTGRSRNDQVATCITLWARRGLAELADASHALATELATQARAHAATPWTARTHGQNASPATLGFLLAAHAHRVQDAAAHVLAVCDAIAESPLGGGAVAGSTLPLQPGYTARLLGLRPSRSALLATGTRDTVTVATEAAARCGAVTASLAQDLMDLFAQKAIRLDPGHTTGSSLMPQKRNPDSLELARGEGKRLAGLHAQAMATTAGLGLGYHRDFQLTKPMLTTSVSVATSTVRILASVVRAMTADPKVLAAGWNDPGLVATDVAEALVAAGLPFRTAYTHVAGAFAQVERGATFPDAIRALGLPGAQEAAALSALTPDPAKRATVGGTAPVQVLAALGTFEDRAALLAPRLEAATTAARAPERLLHFPPATLVAETTQ